MNLLTEINEEAKAEIAYCITIEQLLTDLGHESLTEQEVNQIWDTGKSIEESVTAHTRNDVISRLSGKVEPTVGKHPPKIGQRVMVGKQLVGKIVDIDGDGDNISAVIIRNKDGKEKGFRRNQLAGPDILNIGNSKVAVWKLKK